METVCPSVTVTTTRCCFQEAGRNSHMGTDTPVTRMHSSRMRTARSLTVSHRKNHAPPQSNQAGPPEQPRMPPPGATTHAPPGATMHAPQSNHARPLGATMHAPQQPCTPPSPEQPCMPPPGATMHAHPPSNHACPPWEQPCMPPL